MKRREAAFFRALGDIPESYIDELTQFQAEHARTSGTDRSRSDMRPDEQLIQKERLHMKHTVTDTADKNREAGISVRKLRPVTAGIFASLAACAVIGIGFGTGFFGKEGIGRTPADAPEQSETPVTEELLSAAETTDAAENETNSQNHTDVADSESEEAIPAADENRVFEIYSCFGDNSETTGIPEIPENGALLFTEMADLRPLLERATNTDFPVKGVAHAESCFNSGRNVLLIKTKWIMNSYDGVLRSMYVTDDGVLHADLAYYLNENTDPGLDPSSITHNYMMISVPDSLTEISGSAVQQTLYVSDAAEPGVQDPLNDEMYRVYDDGVYLQKLRYQDADYIFPEISFELYAPESMEPDTSCASMLGSFLNTTSNPWIPERLRSFATEIAEPNLTQLNENCLITFNDVQRGDRPYIAVFENEEEDAAPRRLVVPELKYKGTAESGMRMTILCTSALSADANADTDWNGPLREETPLQHTPAVSAIINHPEFE